MNAGDIRSWILANPYLVLSIATGGILLFLYMARRIRLLYRFLTVTMMGFMFRVWWNTPPEKGAADFRTADTMRILITNHRVLADWKRESGRYPSPTTEGLETLRMYSSLVYPTDAWKRELRYEIVGGKPRLTSAGPDGRFGTGDDVVR